MDCIIVSAAALMATGRSFKQEFLATKSNRQTSPSIKLSTTHVKKKIITKKWQKLSILYIQTICKNLNSDQF